MCDNYLISYYKDAIIDILKDDNETKHFSLNINFVELSGNDPNLGNDFLKDSEKSLEEWNQALKKVQSELISNSDEVYIFKNNAHCRIYSLPLYPELHRTKFPLNEDTNKFLQVTGTVVRMTSVKMLECQRQYICTKCKYLLTVTAEYELYNAIIPPKKCTNPEDCKGANIITLGDLNSEFCKDYQEIRIQENISKLDVGSMPNSMWVTLEDDLVDSCKPGDNITICGLVKRRQNQFYIGKQMEAELVLKANHIQVNNNNISVLTITPEIKHMFLGFWKTYADTPLIARDIILKSISPQLFGLYIVKLAMAVVLAGGSNLHTNFSTGVRIRAEPHLLLVGDPGTGKSQLLRFASKIIPRSVLTTGVGSTAAGLTVTAVMENGEWQLEGGALVMSDGGICCIDEFNTMKEHDRTSIHEAMEQQTISVAKASIVCKLSTRCSIIAATNPKGNLDPKQPLCMNIALASPLLSRFDLILLLKDKIDDQWDSELVDYIFSCFDNCKSAKLTENINWTIETLQAYFAIIKKIHPKLTEDSTAILRNYYQAQRRKNFRNKARTTVRLLDSLVRLSQGHARLMYHEEVEVVDAVMAVILVETSMEADSSVFDLRFNLRNDFPQDPMSNYKELVEIVLTKLELRDLLGKELGSLGRIKNNEKNDKKGTGGRETINFMGKQSMFFQQIQEKTEIINENNRIKTNEILKKNKINEDESEKQLKVQEKDEIPKEKNKTNEDENESEVDDKQQEEMDKISSKFDQEKKASKRAKSKNDIKPKRSKTNKDNKEINKDLAALQCMPSVNDIFHGCDIEDENGFSVNFGGLGIVEEIPSYSKNDEVDVINNGIQKPEENVAKNDEKTAINDKTKKSEVNVCKKLENEVLSQRTKTRNFLSKFKFIPKDDNQQNETSVFENRKSHNLFDENPNLDISFTNIQTSTQKNPKHEATNQESRKFCFKKMEKPIVPSSMFESQEDLDNLDLDI